MMSLQTTKSRWECDTCTYENSTLHQLCEMCGGQKPLVVVNNDMNMNTNVIIQKQQTSVLGRRSFSNAFQQNNKKLNNCMKPNHDDQKMKDTFCFMYPKQKASEFSFFGSTQIKKEGLWQWNENGTWKQLDFETSEQIDDEIISQYNQYKHSADTNKCTNILFAINKGQLFSQLENKGIYFCNVVLTESGKHNTHIKQAVLNNINTESMHHMKRKTKLKLDSYGNGKYPNQNIFSKTAMQHIFNIYDQDYVMNNNEWTVPKKRKYLNNIARVVLIGVYDNSNIWSCFRSHRYIVKNILEFVSCRTINVQSVDSHFKIGDFIDINPIYSDRGWKTGSIVKFRKHTRQVQVQFKHSISKAMLSYWIHLDNKIECAPFGQGHIDEKQVKALFFATVSPSKYKITEVKNIARTDHMHIYESILQSKCKRSNKNKHEMEKYLWHGTKNIDTLQLILKNCFDRSYNKSAAFGNGTYFALKASYSAPKYCGKDANGVYQLLLCRVIVGESTLGKKSMTKIPKKPDGTEYDSLVNNEKDPTIFVSWRDYHSIPCYLIKFKRLE